jgi:hypothetical protein
MYAAQGSGGGGGGGSAFPYRSPHNQGCLHAEHRLNMQYLNFVAINHGEVHLMYICQVVLDEASEEVEEVEEVVVEVEGTATVEGDEKITEPGRQNCTLNPAGKCMNTLLESFAIIQQNCPHKSSQSLVHNAYILTLPVSHVDIKQKIVTHNRLRSLDSVEYNADMQCSSEFCGTREKRGYILE